MSYLNPITLTPKIYQPTDKNAPQLLGQVGDYKSVFKACLVAGYGDKEGAGFTLDNETDRSCDFISPNIMMSKIGVEEEGSYCRPYYYDGTTKVSMTNQFSITRNATRGASWVMFVCELGLYFVVTVNGRSQIIYLGLIKSAINDNNQNFICMNLGSISSSGTTTYIANKGKIGTHTDFNLLSCGYILGSASKQEEFFISLFADVFWRKNGTLLGSQPALLTQNATTLTQETKMTHYQDKAVLYAFVCSNYSEFYIKNHNMAVMISLEDWEF